MKIKGISPSPPQLFFRLIQRTDPFDEMDSDEMGGSVLNHSTLI